LEIQDLRFDMADRMENAGWSGPDARVVGRVCRQCDCAARVVGGRADEWVCANHPDHGGQLVLVASGDRLVDEAGARCRRFRFRRERGQPDEPPMGEGVRHIHVTGGGFVLVDAADFEQVGRHTWHVSGGSDYARATVGGKTVAMHRLIMNAPPGKVVDHINGHRLDNRRSNLRICTRAENLWNARKGRGTSRFKGVFWDSRRHKWGACIHRDGKGYWLGHFTDEVAAAQAYDRAARELFGAFACLNFPQSGNVVLLSGTIRVRSHASGRLTVIAVRHRPVGAGPCTCPNRFGQPQGVAPTTVTVERRTKRAAQPMDERLRDRDHIKRFSHRWAFAPARGPPERSKNHALKPLD
jgi:hypothetical protein